MSPPHTSIIPVNVLLVGMLHELQQDLRYFRIVHMDACRMKALPLAKLVGTRLPDKVMVLSELHAEAVSEDQVDIHWKHTCGKSAIHLLGGFTSDDLDFLMQEGQGFKMWSQTLLHLPTQGASNSCLASLFVAEGMLLTSQFGLLPSWGDCSVCELLLFMSANGWKWKQLPRAGHLRTRLGCYIGGDKICYTKGTSVSKDYLLCLLRLRELGIDAVPHGQVDDVYSRLLEGEKWSELCSNLPAPQAKRRKIAKHDWEVDPFIEGQVQQLVKCNSL